MTPRVEGIPFPPEHLGRFQVVMDLVYQPQETRLLREASAHGCRTIGGIQMLVYQGARQFELFTGRPAPVEIMRRAALAAVGE
jgi:shikimate dehydrogenase